MKEVRREERTVAITVGSLFVTATAAGVAAAGLAAPTRVATMAADRGEVIATAGLIVVMAISVAGVAAVLYPLLLADAETPAQRGMATWFLGSRLTEGALFLVAAAGLLALLAVADGPRSPADGPLEAALAALSRYAMVAGQSVFAVGSALMSWLLLTSGRVPRWLALSGLAAAPLMLAGGLMLPITGDPSSPISSGLYAPMAVQEMLLAGWLIARGFRAVTPGSAVPESVKDAAAV